MENLNDKDTITKALCMYTDACNEQNVQDDVGSAIEMLDDCETITDVTEWLKENI